MRRSSKDAPASEDPDVIVVGAGAAGLAAARRLAERSFRTVVLEARDRIGGRAWSRTSPHGTAELGAEFIHGKAEETRALLRTAGIEALATGGESWMLSERGALERDDDDFSCAAGIFEATDALAADESVERFLRRFEGDPAMHAAVANARAFVEGFDAADPAVASARAIAAEWRSGVNARSARPLGGYAPMFAQLRDAATAAGARIRLSTTVRKISWTRAGVAVEARTPSEGAQTLRARAAIVTLPAGVLREPGQRGGIAFAPALPRAKHAALGYVVMGHAVRVALWFSTPFWERIASRRYRDAAFFRTPGQAFAAYWTQLPARSNQIVAWAGGPKAIALSGVAPSRLVALALAGFGELLGQPVLAREHFEEGMVHDWTRDPFARGAYSYVAVGGGDARASLASPLDGVVFFGGEATSTDGQAGTVNGALQTGVRAADEAAAALTAKA